MTATLQDNYVFIGRVQLKAHCLCAGAFKIVEFVSSMSHGKPTTAIVPYKWMMNDGKCLWPPYRKQNLIDDAVENQENPGENWKVFDIRLLGSAGMFCTMLSLFMNYL